MDKHKLADEIIAILEKVGTPTKYHQDIVIPRKDFWKIVTPIFKEDAMLSMAEVQLLTGMTMGKIYSAIRKGDFPKGIRQKTGWQISLIREFMAQKTVKPEGGEVADAEFDADELIKALENEKGK